MASPEANEVKPCEQPYVQAVPAASQSEYPFSTVAQVWVPHWASDGTHWVPSAPPGAKPVSQRYEQRPDAQTLIPFAGGAGARELQMKTVCGGQKSVLCQSTYD